MFDFFSTAQCKVIALKTRKNDIKRWMSDSYRQRNVEKSTWTNLQNQDKKVRQRDQERQLLLSHS